MRRTLLLAAAVTALATPAWAEGFRTGTAWEGSLFRDAKGQVKSCAAAQRFDTGTTLSFALTREKDLFLVLQNSAIDLPKGERVPVAYAVDRGVAYTTQAFVVRDSVVIDLPNTPAVRDLLAGGSWLSIEGTERSEDFSLKGVAESLKALTACIEQPVAAAKPAPPEPRVAAAAPPPPPAPPPAATAPPPPAPVAAEPVAKAESAAGGVQAQIGTYVSDTRAAAEWERLKKRLSPVLDSYDPLYVQQTRSTDGRTLWLVRVGSFADRDEATRFCDEVKAKGHPDCKPILRP
ncbi:SPOR domain-containing protein [Azospirillum sp.]|uniref:SPOR domain-containing protein n=1 Tax=Azospirillum sp. TaxID=34012 RepID=UPI003D703660